MSFLRKTNQVKKYSLARGFVVTSGVAAIMLYFVYYPVLIFSIPLLFIGSIIAYLSIRCPRCKKSVALKLLKEESFFVIDNKLNEMDSCPYCGYEEIETD